MSTSIYLANSKIGIKTQLSDSQACALACELQNAESSF